MHKQMTQDDRNEMRDSYITRFRAGEIGPVTFRDLCRRIGIDDAEITSLRNLHVDECADNMRKGLR